MPPPTIIPEIKIPIDGDNPEQQKYIDSAMTGRPDQFYEQDQIPPILPPLFSAPVVVPPQHIIEIKSGDVVKYTQDNDPNTTIVGQFVILKKNTAPYEIQTTASGILPKYDPNAHSGRMGLIQFGKIDNTTKKIQQKNSPSVYAPQRNRIRKGQCYG